MCFGRGGWIREKVLIATPCHAVSGHVEPSHAPSGDNQSSKLMPQQAQSVANPSVQGKQLVVKL